MAGKRAAIYLKFEPALIEPLSGLYEVSLRSNLSSIHYFIDIHSFSHKLSYISEHLDIYILLFVMKHDI